MDQVDNHIHDLALEEEATEKSSEELAADCLSVTSCSVEFVDNLLDELKSKEEPSTQVIQIIKELEEVRIQSERNVRLITDLAQGLLEDEESKESYGERALHCIEDGCSVESIDALLDEMKTDNSRSPGLIKTINEMENLREKEEESAIIIKKLMESLPAEEVENKNKNEIAAECLESGCPNDTLEKLLSQLKAEKEPSAEVSQMIEELTELLGREQKREKFIGKVVQSMMVEKPIESSNEELASECLKNGCSAATIESLLQRMKADKRSSPRLRYMIKELEKRLEEESVVEKLVQGLV